MGTVNTGAAAVLVALTLSAATVLAGNGLPDPMRPSGAGAAAADGRGLAPSRPAAELRLQSVLLGRRGAQTAVISGTLVALGDRVGDARLVRLTEHSALLSGPQGAVTLLLIPDIRTQAVAPGVPPPDAAASSTPTKVPTP